MLEVNKVNNLQEIIVASCKQTESLQPTCYLVSLVCLCSRFSRGRKQTDERRKVLETRSTSHMLKDLPERNTPLAGSQQQTNNYSQEIAHEQNTFERRIYGMTIRQIFHRSFNEQRKPFRKYRCNTRTK